MFAQSTAQLRSRRYALLLALALSAGAQSQENPPAVPQSPDAAAANVEPGFLGLIGDDRSEGGRGVRIVKIDRDSPAEKGMLKDGDLIYKINDQPIRSGRDMRRVLSQLPAGAEVRFYVDREGSLKERDVTLSERPARGDRERDFGVIAEPLPVPGGADAQAPLDSGPAIVQRPNPQSDLYIPAPASPDRASLGIRSVPPTELDRAQHGLPNLRGALVLAIASGSPAHLAGIPLHAVVVAIDGQSIAGPTDLARKIATYEPGQEIEVSYYYKRELLRRRIVLADTTEVDSGEQFVTDGANTSAAGDAAAGSTQAGSDRVAKLEHEIDTLNRRVEELERTIEYLKKASQR
jgi:membrane-associated protease RseP (regulator of RpoE activity)